MRVDALAVENSVHVADSCVTIDPVAGVALSPRREETVEIGAAAGPAGTMTRGEPRRLVEKAQQRVATGFGQRALRIVGVAGGDAGQPGVGRERSDEPAVIVVQDPAIADPAVVLGRVADEVPAWGEADIEAVKPPAFAGYCFLCCVVSICLL